MTEQTQNTGEDKKILLLFLAGWVVLNLLQAFFTELAHDEAYYWVWSRSLDWGYIEHPPMVALFIKVGYALIPNEVGVRLLAILFSTLILYLVYMRLVKKDVLLYVALVSSILLFHIGGFFTAPDTPLFLFVGLYYLFLKDYLENDSWRSALIMTVIITTMMYSKYHGVLVLFFTIIFNWKLLTRKTFWAIAITSSLLYLPHVYWLFTEGKPGLEYALSGRFSDPFSLYQVFGNFLLGQIAITGPLIGLIVLYAAFAVRPQTSYQRTLKYVMLGILGYFFIWSFKGRTEANWTASAFIPMLVLAHQYITEREKLRKITLWLAVPSLLIIIAIRLQLMFYFIELPHVVDRHREFNGWNECGEQLAQLSGDKPIITFGYQMASKVWFYTGKPTYTFGNNERPSQFNLMDYEKELLGKQVLAVGNYIMDGALKTKTPFGETTYKWYDDFRSYRQAELIPLTIDSIHKTEEWIELQVELVPPPEWNIPAKADTKSPVHISHNLLNNNEEYVFWNSNKVDVSSEINSPTVFTTHIKTPKKPGTYWLEFALVVNKTMMWKCSERVEIEVVSNDEP